MKVIRSKEFSNGVVYCLELEDGYLIETTDTFLPYYTKDAIGRKQNTLIDKELGSRKERWMVGVSIMSGCPVGCRFCATGQMKKWRNLTVTEIVMQVTHILGIHERTPEAWSGELNPYYSKEFKVNYTRMGEPFLNVDNVANAIWWLNGYWDMGCPTENKIHHYISTIGIHGSDFSWIEDNISLQISLHSLSEQRRKELIPWPTLMSIEELGQIRTGSKLKTTLNLTLVDEDDFDINILRKYFDPKYFFIKLSPINPNPISILNQLGPGIIEANNTM